MDEARNTFVGTMLYMSPEMIKHSTCGKEGDIWAFAVTLFKMVTGVYPFDKNASIETFDAIKNAKYTYPPDFKDSDYQYARKLIDAI